MKTKKDELIKKTRNIVIKIGTSILTDIVDGYPQITTKHIKPLVDSIVKYDDNRNFTIVSSGAIGFGMSALRMQTKPKELAVKQAAAAVGQNKLMQMYDELFAKHKRTVAQVLLTQTGIINRQRYLNAVNTLNALFKLNAIPIINENDTVAVDEIKFGDNDKLGAMVAGMINADLLVLLTNIDGLLEDVKRPDSLIEDVTEITPDLLKICGAASKATTTGGMISKLRAAEMSLSAGVPMIICNGYDSKIIDKIFDCSFKGTFFYPPEKTLPPRKRWIKYNLRPRGKIFVDAGAAVAVLNNKSLLPSGIVNIDGSFERGDCVGVYNLDNLKIAKGLVNYEKAELLLIKGLKTSEIKKKLGYCDAPEIIHVDNMVLLS